MALSLAAHYPDRPELVRAMVQLSQEELEHFGQVFALLDAGGHSLGPDRKDPYVRQMRKHMQGGSRGYFLDRLLACGVIEARGCERFRLLGERLGDPRLAQFYRDLARSEARHAALFVRLAQAYFPRDEVASRLEWWLERESEVFRAMPLRPALH